MLELTPAFGYAFLLILIRTTGMLVSAPLLSHRGIPSYTKVGFALTFSLVLVGFVDGDGLEPPEQVGTIAGDVIREVLFGLCLGLAMNLVWVGLQMASRLIGIQMGFGLGGVFDPVSGADFGVIEHFYSVLATLIFFAINGHHIIISVLVETLRAVPLGTFDPLAINPDALAAVVAGLTLTAVRIALPVVAALALTDLGMGLVARTVPQVHIIVVGMPIKVVVGLVVMAAALPVTVHLMQVVIESNLAGSTEMLLGVQ